MVLKIGIIGDFESERISHKATIETINHCASYLNVDINIEWISTEKLENSSEIISKFDGVWCAPGVYKSTKGAISAIREARVNDIPFIGTCGGFQQTVIEYARNVLGLKDVQHAEYNEEAKNLIISPLSCSLIGEMRKVFIKEDSKIFQIYKKTEVEERFSCNFGINQEYRKIIEDSGFKIAGTDENNEIRILELRGNKFFVATLFQPQLTSSSQKPHELIISYIRNMID